MFHTASYRFALLIACALSASNAFATRTNDAVDCQAALATRQWIAASKFIEVPSAELIDLIASHIGKLSAASGPKPIVVFDLDATLFDVRYRNRTTFRAWGKSLESVQFPEIRKALLSLPLEKTGHYPEDTLTMLGFDTTSPNVAKALASMNPYWRQRFSSADNLVNDSPYSGAYEAVNTLDSAGAHIVYLTARPADAMLAATLSKLRDTGFPVDPSRVTIILKPNKTMDTIVFKNDALARISEMGVVVAFFDNEPGNVVSAWKKFKKAYIVFVDTVASDRKAIPVEGVYRIMGY